MGAGKSIVEDVFDTFCIVSVDILSKVNMIATSLGM